MQAYPGATPLTFRMLEAAWYFQDEFKLRPNLTVRLGLRDEMTNMMKEVNGRAANYTFDQNGVIRTQANVSRSVFLVNNAKALLQPRVGVAWDPTGTGRWAVRAGFGIHNDLLDNLGNRLNQNPPFNARLVISNTPLLTILKDGPIPDTTPAPCNPESLSTPCPLYAPGGLDPKMYTPTTQEWSLEVERGITQDLALELSYSGYQSYHIPTAMDTNAIRPVKCQNPSGCLAGGILAASQWNMVPQGTEYIPAGATRPNRFVGSTSTWMSVGTASYHGGTVSLTKRARSGLTFKTSYTLSKVLDIASGLLSGGHQNEAGSILHLVDLRRNKGLASYNQKHQFSTNFLYELPFGKGRAFGSGASGCVDKLISDWQWNGILNVRSGYPFLPLVGSGRSGNGETRQPDVPNWNPDFKGNVVLGTAEFKKTGHFFDPNAFSLPLAGTFGNVGRGVLTGPAYVGLNTSFQKRIPLKERLNMQFRVEGFNILNHANFRFPQLIVFQGSSFAGSAGVINETLPPERQIQFALRLEF
jgi:hypothetical protein